MDLFSFVDHLNLEWHHKFHLPCAIHTTNFSCYLILDLSPVSTTRVDGRSQRPELTGDRFPLPVNMGRVDGRAFPLAELS